MAGEKSIEEKTRRLANQRPQNGQEFQQMQSAQNQLMQIQASRQQNLRENRMESNNLAQQNQILAQAAQVGMMSNGAGQMQVNPATQNVMGRYGLSRPMTTTTTKQNHQQTITKQNVTIHNNTTNITNTVPANIGGPLPGRPLQFQQQQQQAQQQAAARGGGGMDKFKAWLNQTFTKQEEERVKRDREYQRRELSLSKSASKMMRKLEEFSRDMTKKLDPRNVGKNAGSQIKTIFRLLGLGALVVNFQKILDWLDKTQKKLDTEYVPEIKKFFKWAKGEEGSQEPAFVAKLKKSITDIIIGEDGGNDSEVRDAFRKNGLIGGFGAMLEKQWDKLKDRLGKNWEYVRNIPKPEKMDIFEIGKYLVSMISTLFTGEKGYRQSVTRSLESSAENRRNEEFSGRSGRREFTKGDIRGAIKNDGGRVSSGVHTYLDSEKGYKYVANDYLSRNKKSLAVESSPLIDENGNLVLDENGNVRTVTKTSRNATMAQGGEIANLLRDARKGKADPVMMTKALERMGEAVKKDGEVTIFWATLEVLVGKEEAKSKFENKKIRYRLIERPKTLYELSAERDFKNDESFKKIANSVALKKLGLTGAVRTTSTIAGAGVGAGVGAFFGGIGAGPGALGGAAIGWASSFLATEPAVIGFVELAKSEGINPYCLDYIPVGNSENDALKTAKLLYGDETVWYGHHYEDVVNITAQEWLGILRGLFGEGINSVDQFGLEAENIGTNRSLEAAMKGMNAGNKYKPLSSFSDIDFMIGDYTAGFGGSAPSAAGGYANQRSYERGSTIPLGDLKQEEAVASARSQEMMANFAADLDWRKPAYITPEAWNSMTLEERVEAVRTNEEGKVKTAEHNKKEKAKADAKKKERDEQTAKELSSKAVSTLSNFDPTQQSFKEFSFNSSSTGQVSPGWGPGTPNAYLENKVTNAGEREESYAEDMGMGYIENTGEPMEEEPGVNPNGQVFDIGSAVEYLQAHARNDSTGMCAKHVREAMQAGGLDVSGRPGYGGGYATYLPQIGWRQIPNNSQLLPGDISVTLPFKNNTTHKYGHIAMWTGQRWISDFVQNGRDVYKSTGGTPEKMMKLFRFGGPKAQIDPNYRPSTSVGSAYILTNDDVEWQDIDGNWRGSKRSLLGFLDKAKDTIINATGSLTRQLGYYADKTKQTYIKLGQEGSDWEMAHSGGLANYDHGVRVRSSAEQAIYDRYSGQISLPSAPVRINGKDRNEWWASFFDEKGNLKAKETENINPELKSSLKVIEAELKKSNGMDELQLKLAANSLDNSIVANAGQTARDQRLLNAMVARKQTVPNAMSTTENAARGIQQQ